MLANFFEKSKPVTFIVILLLFLGYFILAFFNRQFIVFYTNNGAFTYIGYFFILISTFFFYNFIVAKNSLTFDNGYAFMFFIICLGLISQTFLDEKTLFLNLILLLFLRKVYSLKSSKQVFLKLFDGGLWLGFAFLFEPFLAIFAILFYVAIYIHQKITFKTLLIPVIGFIVPLFLYFTYCFWHDKTENFYQLFNWLTNYNLSTYNNIKLIFPLVIIGLFLLFSVFAKTPKTLSIKNTFRKNWILVLLNFLIALTLIILLKEHTVSELLFLLFPISVILANGIELLEKIWLKDIIIAVFLISSFVVYFL